MPTVDDPVDQAVDDPTAALNRAAGQAVGRTRAVDQLGRARVWEWDARYNLTAFENALGHRWAISWNDQRQPLSVTVPGGQTARCHYDAHGLPSSITDTLGRTNRTIWDGLLREPLAITGADGQSWHCEYDKRGLLAEVTAPDSNTTRYAQDSAGQVVHITDAHGGVKRIS